jgi:hypothetical protein
MKEELENEIVVFMKKIVNTFNNSRLSLKENRDIYKDLNIVVNTIQNEAQYFL